MITISRTYNFDAAHWLPLVPAGHKCGRLHGHTYELTVEVTGPVGPLGWIDDFADIDAVIKPLVASLDHRCLNDLIENPTSEQLVEYVARCLSALNLVSVTLSETAKSRARWTP